MIIGRLDNWSDHLSGPVWARAFEFIRSLDADSPDAETAIAGSDMFARVMSYETRTTDRGVLEAHREYIDIQSAIVNCERIDWFPAKGLTVKTPYDATNDVEFFERPGAALAHADIHPGTFAVLYPEDAHMPQLVVGEKPCTVKKVVIKIRLTYLRESNEGSSS